MRPGGSMQISETLFNQILLELVEENPLACRALLRIADVRFTGEVPTLAITLTGAKPSMLVNLAFLRRHCKSETHVKAVIVHEFLHVLLNHTEKFKKVTPEINIALDAVINAIIHRMLGPEYSGMMSEFYSAAPGCLRLLRPMNALEHNTARSGPEKSESLLFDVWQKLYSGALVADDILEVAELLKKDGNGGAGAIFLGDHSPKGGDSKTISEEARKAIETTMRSMTGGGIWRSPRDRGIGNAVQVDSMKKKSKEAQLWEHEAVNALRKCVTPDRNSRNAEVETGTVQVPILNASDKRGFLKAIWNPFIPEILWPSERKKPVGTVQIYLDVSGSMSAEMDTLVSLLWKVRKWIRLPFWAFSDIVAPATIKNGTLKTSTTGGTSMNAVLEHVAETRPEKAVVITDGYIEECDATLLAAVRDQKIHAIVSRDGAVNELVKAGIPYIQLPRYTKE